MPWSGVDPPQLVRTGAAARFAQLLIEEKRDTAAIRHFVDAATTADPHYTPSTTRREAYTLDTQARYARWQTAYRALKQQHPRMSDVWYARQIAKQAVAAGRDASTIRRHMTRRQGAVTRRG